MTQQISQPGQPAAPYAPPAGPYVPTPRYGREPVPAGQPASYGQPPVQQPAQYGPPSTAQPQAAPQQPGQYGRPAAPYGQQPPPQYGTPQPPAVPPQPPYGYGQPKAPATTKRRTGLLVSAIVGVLVIAGLAVGAIFLFGSKSLDTAEAQSKIAALTKQQIGITPTDVSCPADVDLKAGTTFHCTAKLDGQAISYTVKETDDKGNVRVDSDNNLILVSKVEESVAQQVGDQAGVTATATCDTGGKQVLVDSQNKPINCTVVNSEDDTDTLDVQATVDDQGNVSWTS
jgi:Domain of unknown function (DUF4333)